MEGLGPVVYYENDLLCVLFGNMKVGKLYYYPFGLANQTRHIGKQGNTKDF